MILLRTKSYRLQSKKWNKSLSYEETLALPVRLQDNKQSNFQTAHDRVISSFHVGMCRRRLNEKGLPWPNIKSSLTRELRLVVGLTCLQMFTQVNSPSPTAQDINAGRAGGGNGHTISEVHRDSSRSANVYWISRSGDGERVEFDILEGRLGASEIIDTRIPSYT